MSNTLSLHDALPISILLLWIIFMPRFDWRTANFACLAVGIGLPFFRQITNSLVIAGSHVIAKYSYGIYLMHPFSIVLGLHLMPSAPLALQLTVMLTTTAVFSVCTYHLLEKPMINLGSRVAALAETRYEQHETSSFHRVAPKAIQ